MNELTDVPSPTPPPAAAPALAPAPSSPSTCPPTTAITTVAAATPASSPRALRQVRARVRGGKYFTEELLNLFSIMSTILPIGPIEWEKVTETHSVKFPGRDTDSLRRKYTSTHRRKVPTGDPDCPPEVREAKRVKMAIGSKAELADCANEFDMEAETMDDDGS